MIIEGDVEKNKKGCTFEEHNAPSNKYMNRRMTVS